MNKYRKQLLEDYIENHQEEVDRLDLQEISLDLNDLTVVQELRSSLFKDFMQLLVDELGVQGVLDSASSRARNMFDSVVINDTSIATKILGWQLFRNAEFKNDFHINKAEMISSEAFHAANMHDHSLIIHDCPAIDVHALEQIININSIVLPPNLTKLGFQDFTADEVICNDITMSDFIKLMQGSDWHQYSKRYIASGQYIALSCDVKCKDGVLHKGLKFDKDYNVIA